jgi:protein gp37
VSAESAIEWTDSTWNPTTGCDRISPGCDHCYALTLASRLKRMGQPRYQRDGDPRTSGPGFGLTLHYDALNAPLKWRKPRMVFVNSMSDLFHKSVPVEFLHEVWETMEATPQHTYQILTKRPKRMANILGADVWPWPEPLPNVWLGTSIENRDYAWRADHLARTPAAVRFISAEPLLGPLIPDSITVADEGTTYGWHDDYDGAGLRFYRDGKFAFDWLIVGGESGNGHRPIDPEWVRDLRDVCMHEGVAFFFKQWGGLRPKSNGRELDGRTWDEMPAVVAA